MTGTFLHARITRPDKAPNGLALKQEEDLRREHAVAMLLEEARRHLATLKRLRPLMTMPVTASAK